jgi:hypothetical protein
MKRPRSKGMRVDALVTDAGERQALASVRQLAAS